MLTVPDLSKSLSRASINCGGILPDMRHGIAALAGFWCALVGRLSTWAKACAGDHDHPTEAVRSRKEPLDSCFVKCFAPLAHE